MLKEFETFYSSLYDSNKPAQHTIHSFLNDHFGLQQLTEQHRNLLDDDISAEEIKSAIKKMKTNKSPGPDGFQVEFFRTYADILIPEMQQTFNSIIQQGVLPLSWYAAELVPIFKQGGAKRLNDLVIARK